MTPARTNKTTEGAVYVEFLIAFLPMFVFFMSLVQLTFLHTANLIVQHAATKTVRAAVVVLDDDKKAYDDEELNSAAAGSKRRRVIEGAAALTLAPIGSSKPTVIMKDSYGTNEVVNVRVEFEYHCRVPVGALFTCGLSRTKKFAAEAALPNQGALYPH